MKDLIIKCLKNDYEVDTSPLRSQLGVNNVYMVETDNDALRYWNSSNNKVIEHIEVLRLIAEKLSEGDTDGSVSDPFTWAEIMFEVIEK